MYKQFRSLLICPRQQCHSEHQDPRFCPDPLKRLILSLHFGQWVVRIQNPDPNPNLQRLDLRRLVDPFLPSRSPTSDTEEVPLSPLHSYLLTSRLCCLGRRVRPSSSKGVHVRENDTPRSVETPSLWTRSGYGKLHTYFDPSHSSKVRCESKIYKNGE